MISVSLSCLPLSITAVCAMRCGASNHENSHHFQHLRPLINPARPNIELMGVYSKDLVRPIAQTMLQMGLKRAAVVHGSGLDEVAIHGETQ